MDKDRLRRIIPVVAAKHNFRQEIIEKDFYLTIILNQINADLSNKIVFKGGTLLHKIYLNYSRLSEDLDFTYFADEHFSSRSKRSKAMEPIRKKMPSFLESLELGSEEPKGRGFNNSTQYLFNISYPSIVTGKEENIKIEVSLRQFPIEQPVSNIIKHIYKDPFTAENLIPEHEIWSLSFRETVAEKLKASFTRKDLAIRDFYDLWHISEAKFNFLDKEFLSVFKKKLKDEGYEGDCRNNFGLEKETGDLLRSKIETDLLPVIRIGEDFNLDNVFLRFNKIFKDFDL